MGAAAKTTSSSDYRYRDGSRAEHAKCAERRGVRKWSRAKYWGAAAGDGNLLALFDLDRGRARISRVVDLDLALIDRHVADFGAILIFVVVHTCVVIDVVAGAARGRDSVGRM